MTPRTDHHLILQRHPLGYLDEPSGHSTASGGQQDNPQESSAVAVGADSLIRPTSAVDVDRLLALWGDPLPIDDEIAAARFRSLYADPVVINGRSASVAELVTSGRTLQAAIGQPQRQLLHHLHAGNQTAIAFILEGNHIGPLRTGAGYAPPTGNGSGCGSSTSSP